MGVLEPTPREERRRRAKRCVGSERQTTVEDAEDPLGLSGDAGVVGHEQDRRPVLVADAVQHVEDLGARLGVERAGRLVGEQQPRPVRERARDRDALALAAGEGWRVAVGARREADLVQQLARAAVALGPAVPAEQRHLHVLERGQRRNRKLLEPNDFSDLGELARTLNAFEHHWNEIAEPFDWRFTRDDLAALITRLAAHESQLQLAA